MDEELTVPELLGLTLGPFTSIFHNKPSDNFVRELMRYTTLRGLWTTGHVAFIRYISCGTH